jgi:hypothetical protein
MELMQEGLPAPFADRPDSGNTLELGMHDLMALQDEGKQINVVFEDGKKPKDVLVAENRRRQLGLAKERTLYGGGGAFMGQRRDLETAYKACYFHNGTPGNRTDVIETIKICLDDQMKQGIPGLAQCFFNPTTGFYTVGAGSEKTPEESEQGYRVLYDNLTNPGIPYFDPIYDPQSLATCKAITDGIERSKSTRDLLGPAFTLDVEPNRTAINMTKVLRSKRSAIYKRALSLVGE